MGHFTDCEAKDLEKPHLKPEEVFQEMLGWLKVPVIDRFQYGHNIAKKLTLPLGVRARLDADRAKLTVLESAVE